MTKLTLTKEEMIENLYLAAEEIALQCMILNRRKLVQAMYYMHAHVDLMGIDILPANTVHKEGFERPESLGRLNMKFDFYDWQSLTECHESYDERMQEIDVFVRYLDHLIAMNKRIEVEIKEKAA